MIRDGDTDPDVLAGYRSGFRNEVGSEFQNIADSVFGSRFQNWVESGSGLELKG